MSHDDKSKLMSALSDNALDIQGTARRLLGTLSDTEWQQVMDRITELRAIRKDLERRLAALENFLSAPNRTTQ